MKSMKKFAFLLLTLMFLIIPTVQAADYVSLKNEYIQNHPGQSIIPFSWEASASEKVLPFNYTIPAAPTNNISITASRGQFESGSFIISAQKNLSGIQISIPNLYSTQGNAIPADAINMRLVKVWYQAGNDPFWVEYITPEYILTPELLIKDDALVKVDYVNKINYLKVTINGSQQYIDISNPSVPFPSNAKVYDASSLQPFSLKANENKQLWLTLHIPDNTPEGDYSGNIIITAPSEVPVAMNLSVRVLPFDLEPTPLTYGLFYAGKISPYAEIFETERYYYKTSATYLIELQNMKEHGVLYPTLHQEDTEYLDTELALRNAVGLPKDKIYINSWFIGNATDPAGLTTLANKVINWRNHTESYGYTNTYFYGIDEAKGDILLSQRAAWQTVHKNGGKIFATGWGSELIKMGDILDTSVVAYAPNETQADLLHNYGHKILSFQNPQAGIENPEIYRKNYGFTLWNSGYDGEMAFAYQYRMGQSIWNDYDGPGNVFEGQTYHYRDHVFTYPTSNGVIDTVQWEGFREGVDDTRYVASLIKKDGNDTSAKTIVSAGISNNDNMTAIRKNVINQILLSNLPLASFTGTPLTGTAPLTVTFTDTSTNSPTSWAWTFGDGGTSTVKNPSHQYTTAGTYSVSLKATNTAGSNSMTRTNYITVTAARVTSTSQTGVGIFQSGGTWYLDMNNNGAWDSTPTDRTFSWGKQSGDISITGDWNGDGITETGIFREGTWYLDMNNNGAWDSIPTDKTFSWGKQPGDIPITGDWNGDNIDETGIFRNGDWYLDMNNKGIWEGSPTDKEFSWGKQPGDVPITGDWNGNGITKTGIFRPGTGFYLDMNNNGAWDPTSDTMLIWGLQPNDIPVSGDWNGDGITETGIFRNGDWYLDINNNGIWNSGTDVIYPIGQPGDKPITGTW
jgi:PKD repeat protein